jgi:transposase InsO family protein
MKKNNNNNDVKDTDTKTYYTPKTKFQQLVKDIGINEEYTINHQKDRQYNHYKNNIPLYPNYNIMLDTLELPVVDKKHPYKYLLTAIDLGTNKIDFEPMKSTKSSEALNALKEISKRPNVKIPKFSIMTDNGAEFKKDFNQYLIDHGIYHKYSQPYRHSQQAPIESVNNLLSRLLHGYLNNIELKTGKKETNWLPILPILRKELNNYRYYRDLPKLRQEQPFFNYKLASNEKPQYSVGDYVYRKYDQPHNALGQVLPGKFRRGDLRYSPEVKQIEKIVYFNDKPYYRYVLNDLPSVSFTAKQLIRAKRSEKTYLVREIIGREVRNGVMYYKIWWKNYLKSQSSWEPATQLIDDGMVDYIKAFNEKLRNKKKNKK